MIMHTSEKAIFHAVLPKSFTNDKGEEVNYWELVYFPLIEENGNITVSDEPKRQGIKRDAVESFKNFNKGDKIHLLMEAYVAKAKIADVKSLM